MAMAALILPQKLTVGYRVYASKNSVGTINYSESLQLEKMHT